MRSDREYPNLVGSPIPELTLYERDGSVSECTLRIVDGEGNPLELKTGNVQFETEDRKLWSQPPYYDIGEIVYWRDRSGDPEKFSVITGIRRDHSNEWYCGVSSIDKTPGRSWISGSKIYRCRPDQICAVLLRNKHFDLLREFVDWMENKNRSVGKLQKYKIDPTRLEKQDDNV